MQQLSCGMNNEGPSPTNSSTASTGTSTGATAAARAMAGATCHAGLTRIEALCRLKGHILHEQRVRRAVLQLDIQCKHAFRQQRGVAMSGALHGRRAQQRCDGGVVLLGIQSQESGDIQQSCMSDRGSRTTSKRIMADRQAATIDLTEPFDDWGVERHGAE